MHSIWYTGCKMNSVNIRAGKVVAKARGNLKLSQLDLAELLGVTRTSVSNIERGKQAMSLVMFCKIADHLHVPPHVLLEEAMNSPHGTLEGEYVEDWVVELMAKEFSGNSSSFIIKGEK
jgi:transcriptional regulator with XRE-family HTH domain